MEKNSLNSVFKLYFVILEACVSTIKELYHSHNANDIKSYQAIMINRIAKSFGTMIDILEVSNDPITGYCLLRTIADSVYTYCFIYDNDNNEEVEFRHYLYLLDGCSQFAKTFSSVFNNNIVIEEDDEENLCKSVDQEKTDMNDFQKQLLLYVNNTHLVLDSTKDIKKIIDNRDWKYRSIMAYSKNKSYNWRDIYEKAGCDDSMINFLSVYLSQFVHGLFLSNTNKPDAEAHYILIYNNAIKLEYKLLTAIFHIYRIDNIKQLMLKHIDINKFNDLNIDRKSILLFFNDII